MARSIEIEIRDELIRRLKADPDIQAKIKRRDEITKEEYYHISTLPLNIKLVSGSYNISVVYLGELETIPKYQNIYLKRGTHYIFILYQDDNLELAIDNCIKLSDLIAEKVETYKDLYNIRCDSRFVLENEIDKSKFTHMVFWKLTNTGHT